MPVSIVASERGQQCGGLDHCIENIGNTLSQVSKEDVKTYCKQIHRVLDNQCQGHLHLYIQCTNGYHNLFT